MLHFSTITDYCKAINIAPPKHPYFDVRSFEENMPSVNKDMPAFRHEFFAIALKYEGRGKAITGHFEDFPEGATVFFNSPFQMLSWQIEPNWKGYYIMFSKEFLAQSHYFNSLLDDFPFLKIDKAIPFEIKPEELSVLLPIYETIEKEYKGNKPDSFQIINSYTLLLLNYVNRYFKEQITPEQQKKALRSADLKLLSQYQTLIQTSFYADASIAPTDNLLSTSFYAQALHVHPNHLNAVVKKITGVTALGHIHQHVIQLAKAQLLQTNHSIKEIAYSLHFESPNHFSTFFKKRTDNTPLDFRTTTNL